MFLVPKAVQERLAALTEAKLDEAIKLGPTQLLPVLRHRHDFVSVGEQSFERFGSWSLSAGAYIYQVRNGPVLLCAQGNATHPWRLLLLSRISWDIGVRVADDGSCQPLTAQERRLIPW